MKTVEERFWEKVGPHDDPTKCWLWTAATMNGHGLRYGVIRVGSLTDNSRRMLLAHRVAEHDTERVKRSNDKMSTKRALSPILEETSVTVSVTGGSLCGRNS